MLAADSFLDSNVLIYALSSTDVEKQGIAMAIVSRAIRDRDAVISAQVVQECLNVVTGKLEAKISGSAKSLLTNYLMPLCAIFPSETLYVRALGIKTRYRFSFYDSCIVAAALQSGVATLLTEDLQDGQVIDGMAVRNPFRL